MITLDSLYLLDAANTENEDELTFICHMTNVKQLVNAYSKEWIEEWQLVTDFTGDDRHGLSGNIRVRCYDGTEYETSTKTYTSTGADETNLKASEDFFNHFKMLAPVGSIRRRHVFKIPGMDIKWELDAYYDSMRRVQNWCKLDLEGGDLNNLPEFPVDFDEVIGPKRTPEENAKGITIFRDVFQIWNEDNILPITHKGR